MLYSYDNRGNAHNMTQVQSEIIKIFHLVQLQPTDNQKFTNLNYGTTRLCKSEDSHQGQQQ